MEPVLREHLRQGPHQFQALRVRPVRIPPRAAADFRVAPEQAGCSQEFYNLEGPAAVQEAVLEGGRSAPIVGLIGLHELNACDEEGDKEGGSSDSDQARQGRHQADAPSGEPPSEAATLQPIYSNH